MELGQNIEKIDFNKRTESDEMIRASNELSMRIADLIPDSKMGGIESLEELSDAVCKAEGEVYDNYELLDEDCEALGVTAMLVETVKRLERAKTLSKQRKTSFFGTESVINDEAKIISVELQQTLAKLVLESFDTKEMMFRGVYSVLLQKMMELSDYYLDIDKKTHSLVEHGGVMDGVRSMVTAAILFRHNGADVYFPETIDDVKRGTDLVVVIEGAKFGVSLKSKGIHHLSSGKMSDPCSLEVQNFSTYEDATVLDLNFPSLKKQGDVEGWGPFVEEIKHVDSRYLHDRYIQLCGVYKNDLGIPSEGMLGWFAGEYNKIKARVKPVK